MLKIKDNVDLKELEKFGFEEYFKSGEYFKEHGTIDIVVTKERELDIKRATFETSKFDIINTIDSLFDLIKNDLVKKVEW